MESSRRPVSIPLARLIYKVTKLMTDNFAHICNYVLKLIHLTISICDIMYFMKLYRIMFLSCF